MGHVKITTSSDCTHDFTPFKGKELSCVARVWFAGTPDDYCKTVAVLKVNGQDSVTIQTNVFTATWDGKAMEQVNAGEQPETHSSPKTNFYKYFAGVVAGQPAPPSRYELS